MTKNNINIQHKIYCPVLAQLVERWTVTVFFYVVIHRSLVRFQQTGLKFIIILYNYEKLK